MEEAEKLSFISTLLPVAIVIFIIALGVILLTQQFRKNLYKQKLEQEKLKYQHQVDLLRSSIDVQEEERKRIARDMHDELGATLSITRMHLLQAERQYGHQDEKLLADLQNIRSLTETSLMNMRQISHQLMPPLLENFGLVKTLEFVSAQLAKTGAVELELRTPDAMPDLSWPVKLTLYRVFMELINNTIKHAGASAIVIELGCDARHVIGNYNDNGKGLVNAAYQEGLGHKSMEARIKALGGTIVGGNGDKGGYRAIISIPLGT